MIIEILRPLQDLVSSDSGIHWILGGSTLAAIVTAAVSFGSMKADNKNNRHNMDAYYKAMQDDLDRHKDDDDKRFESFDNRLSKIDENTSAIKSWVDEQKGYNKAMKEKEF